MNHQTNWILNLVDKITSPLKTVEKQANGVDKSMNEATKSASGFGDCLKRLKPIDWQGVKMGVGAISGMFDGAAEIGRNYEDALLQVSAITGIEGDALDDLGSQARGLAKEFGETAADNLGTFQTILSRLGPQIGESSDALGNMGKYANVLSKTMGGNVTGAVDALTTSMLQFRVNLDDPAAAANEMERMMNVIAAGAKYGAAEVPQISESLTQAGVAAKLANLSFEETNAAIQAMAAGGKYGSEAGVAIRNVITNMSAETKLTKEATDALSQYGISFKDIADTTVPFSDRLKKLQPLQNDINALTAIFKSENAAAAQVLISSAGNIEDLTNQVTGTATAYEQADRVMDGWTERLKRGKQWVDNLKIGTLDFTNVMSIGFGVIGGGLATIADFSTIYSGLTPVIKSATVAVKGLSVWSKIAAVSTKIWTGAQWLLNIALNANPIGLIILGVAALIGIIAAVVKWYDKWGAAATLLLGPLGLIINIIMTIKRNWDSITDAFTNGGFIAGIKRIGVVLLDVILYPVQQLLEILSYIPGLGKLAGKGAAAIQNIRVKLDLAQPDDEKKENKQESKSTGVTAKSIIGDKKTGRPDDTDKNTVNDKKIKELNLSRSGNNSGGGKSITMNLTMNITNNGLNDPDKFTEQVVRNINDKLNDAMAAA